jgi:hypothetical protein
VRASWNADSAIVRRRTIRSGAAARPRLADARNIFRRCLVAGDDRSRIAGGDVEEAEHEQRHHRNHWMVARMKPWRCCGSIQGSQLRAGNVLSSSRTPRMPSTVLTGCARRGCRRLEPCPLSAATGAGFGQLESLIKRRRIVRRRILCDAPCKRILPRGKRFCSAPPLNNRTFILHLVVMPPAVRAVCLIRKENSPLFPIPADQFPVLAKIFPVSIFREFGSKTLNHN